MMYSQVFRLAALAGAAGAGIFASSLSLAAPIGQINIVATGPTYFDGNDPTAQVTYNFNLALGGSPPTADDVLVFTSFYVAYDPNVITYNHYTPGTGMDVPGGDAAVFQFLNRNYKTDDLSPAAVPGTFDPGTVSGYDIGVNDPLVPVSQSGPPAYFDGSLLFQVENFTNVWADLLAVQQNGATLFSITFDVNTAAIAHSSIMMLDDRNYMGFDPEDPPFIYDEKVGGGDQTYFELGTNEVDVPVPAPLLLMAAGLLGFGAVRRARGARS